MPVSVITWVHVPPGSRLEVRVSPNDGAFISGGDIFMDDKGLLPVKQWKDAELRAGPAVEQLKDGVDYTVDIRAAAVSSDPVDGAVSAVLLEDATGKVLAHQERTFTIEPGTHHLVRVFVDADPILAHASVVTKPKSAKPGPALSVRTKPKKRGK